MIRSIMYLIVIMIPFASCESIRESSQNKKLPGIYRQQDDKYNHLTLTIRKDSSFLYTILKYRQWDTVAFGNWQPDSKYFISLSSPGYILKPLKVTCTESKNLFDDTCYVIINSPRNRNIYPFDSPQKDIKYIIGALTSDSSFLQQIQVNDFSNSIKLYNPHKKEIIRLITTIYAKRNSINYLVSNYDNEGINIAKADTYTPKSAIANVFTLNIPDLTYLYLNTRRLDKDYVKIVGGKKLLWDGHIFIKQKKAEIINPLKFGCP